MMLGLAAFMVTDPSTGQQIDCDSWSNLFNLTCWGYGKATDALVGQQQTLNLPTPAVTAVPTQAQLDTVANSDNPGAAASQLTGNLAAAALAQTQANIQSANPQDNIPDCSGLLSPLITQGCGGTFSIWPWLAIGGVVALSVFALKKG